MLLLGAITGLPLRDRRDIPRYGDYRGLISAPPSGDYGASFISRRHEVTAAAMPARGISRRAPPCRLT